MKTADLYKIADQATANTANWSDLSCDDRYEIALRILSNGRSPRKADEDKLFDIIEAAHAADMDRKRAVKLAGFAAKVNEAARAAIQSQEFKDLILDKMGLIDCRDVPGGAKKLADLIMDAAKRVDTQVWF